MAFQKVGGGEGVSGWGGGGYIRLVMAYSFAARFFGGEGEACCVTAKVPEMVREPEGG